jgi:hypothetical protein
VSGSRPESPARIRELIALYRATHYDVILASGRIATLRIGATAVAGLRDWIGNDRTAAFLTACNPRSSTLSPAENERMQCALRSRLRTLPCRLLEGVGHMPGADQREPSLLVTGIDLAGIDVLAREFEQNAVVAIRAGGCAVLRIYRDDWRDALAGEPDIALA